MAADLERWEIKAICMAALFVTMSIMGLLPLAVAGPMERLGKKGEFMISILSCFGGGCFLGAYLMHLSPEVREILEESFMAPRGVTYAVPEAFAAIGFFMILFLEKMILFCRARSEKKEKKAKAAAKANGGEKVPLDDADSHSHLPFDHIRMVSHANHDDGYSHDALSRFFTKEENRSRSNTTISEARSRSNTLQKSRSNTMQSTRSGVQRHEGGKGPTGISGMALKNRLEQERKALANANANAANTHPHAYTNPVMVPDQEKKALEEKKDLEAGSSTMSTFEEEGGEENQFGMGRLITFILALTLDSVFGGLAMGLSESKKAVLNMFVAVIAHEFIMSFYIGIELYKYTNNKVVIAAAFLYGFTPPLGGIIGTAVRESQGGSMENEQTIETVSGILQGLSAGVFIYCAFIGILAEELTHDNSFWKSIAVLCGCGLMAGMSAIPDEAFGDGPEEAMTTADPLATAIMVL